MKQLSQYFFLELKKTFLQFPMLLIGSIFLLAISFSCIFLTRTSSYGTEKNPPVFIGILAEKDEPFIDWIIKAANNMPDMGYSVHIEQIDKKTAEHHFFDNETNVLFIIPKHYISSIMHGENKHVTIRFSKTQTTIVNTLMKELAAAASSFILDTEAAMYSMHDYYQKYRLPNETKDDLSLNIKYVKEIVSFSNSMKSETSNAVPESSIATDLLSGGMVLLPLLFGLILAPVMTSERISVKKELTRIGIHFWKQALVKELVFFLVIFASFFGIAILWFLLQNISVLPLHVLSESTLLSETLLADCYGSFFLLISCSPVYLFAAAFSLFIYEISGDASGGMMLLFFSTIFMALFSGLFYPIRYLPEFLKHVAGFLPTRYAQIYIMKLFHQEPVGKEIFLLLLYSICFYLLTTLLSVMHSRKS